MTERIAEEKLNEIRQAVDIVDVISDYVQLKKQGRNYFGLCPFHGENTPSFSVSQDKQIYHCFGCGAGGNAFSFLMELEGYSFQEAAIKLADKGNIQLEIDASSVSVKDRIPPDIQHMLEAHELLCKFYHHLLINTKDGQNALEYLLSRGFTMDSIMKYQIGYSLNSWDFVYKFLTKRKFPIEIIEKAGLIIRSERDGNYFDRFRNRIMFPIFDRNGNPIAFSGRALGDDEPKYLNSPETAIFNKSKILYNFHLARPQIKRLQQAVLFEGFADVIAADRAGVENALATMGTSLTADHINDLRRNVQSITICYDSDNAGIEAAFRAANMLSDAGCQVRVALMPDGMDPDEYIKQYGNEKFQKEVIDGSITLMAFKLLYYRRGKRLHDEGDRLLYLEEVLKEISRLDNAVERDYYLRQLSKEFSLSLEALQEQQKQAYFSERRKNKGQSNSAFKSEPRNLGQMKQLRPAFFTAERSLIAHMLRNSEIAFKVQDLLQGNTFNVDEHQAIFTYLLGFYENGNVPDPSLFINFITDEKLKRAVVDIEMMEINDEISEQELMDYLKQVFKYPKMLMIKEKTANLKEAERQNNFVKAALIAEEIKQLRKSL